MVQEGEEGFAEAEGRQEELELEEEEEEGGEETLNGGWEEVIRPVWRPFTSLILDVLSTLMSFVYSNLFENLLSRRCFLSLM